MLAAVNSEADFFTLSSAPLVPIMPKSEANIPTGKVIAGEQFFVENKKN